MELTNLKNLFVEFENEFKKLDCHCKQIKEVEKFFKTFDLKLDMNGFNKTIPATGSIVSVIFYVKFQIKCEGFEFNGQGGGLSSPGAGALFGDLYITEPDIYRDTVSFAYVSTPVYCAVMFFDSSSKLLGHLQSGAVSVILGTGGGSGTWNEK